MRIIGNGVSTLFLIYVMLRSREVVASRALSMIDRSLPARYLGYWSLMLSSSTQELYQYDEEGHNCLFGAIGDITLSKYGAMDDQGHSS